MMTSSPESCRAAQALLKGDAETAIELYTELLDTKCNVSSILINRGAAFSIAGRHSLAVADLRQVIAFKPLLLAHPSNTAMLKAWLAINGMTLAKNTQKITLREDSIKLGLMVPQVKWTQLCLPTFLQALSLQPSSLKVLYRLGVELAAEGSLRQAEGALLAASRLAPHSKPVRQALKSLREHPTHECNLEVSWWIHRL
jgi:Flp pilus assembly protein TadD